MSDNLSLSLLMTAVVMTVTAAATCTLTRWFFIRGALFDRPGTEAHKMQQTAVPYGGGSGIIIALGLWLIAALLGLPVLAGHLVSSLTHNFHCRALPAHGRGLGLEHYCYSSSVNTTISKPMRARWKFFLQTVIMIIVVVGSGIRIDALQDWPIIAHGLAIFWLLTVCNAFNLLDHGDGVSASTGMISAGVLVVAAATVDDLIGASSYSALIGVLAGFCYGTHPSAIVHGRRWVAATRLPNWCRHLGGELCTSDALWRRCRAMASDAFGTAPHYGSANL